MLRCSKHRNPTPRDTLFRGQVGYSPSPLALRRAGAVTTLADDDGRCWNIPVDPTALLRHWPRLLPGAAQLEQAIAEIEHAPMPLLRPLPARDGTLRVLHAQAAGLLALAPPTAPGTVSAGASEHPFDRQARVAAGLPAMHEGLPDDPDVAARLLVPREPVHQAGVSRRQVTGIA